MNKCSPQSKFMRTQLPILFAEHPIRLPILGRLYNINTVWTTGILLIHFKLSKSNRELIDQDRHSTH